MTPCLDYGDGICAIDAHYQRAGVVAFYLLVEGREAAFLDTGTALAVPQALAALRSQGLRPEDVAYVIPTHVHLDHAGGAGELMRRLPNARLIAHPRAARHLIDPSKLIAGVTEVYGREAMARNFGNIVPVPAERVTEAPDQYTVTVNGRTLLFLDTPGHARHHFCVFDERSGGIFAGDTFGVSYRAFDSERGEFVFPTTTPVQFEPEALHASIERLLSRRPRQLFLTHFGRVRDAPRLARDMHELIDAFVALARRCRGAGAERHRLLIEGQRAVLHERLATHGCRLGREEIDRWLGMDLELNAQGLEVWLDRNPAA